MQLQKQVFKALNHRKSTIRCVLATFALSATIFDSTLSCAAPAEVASAVVAEEFGGLEEITVTARRRQENLMQVPDSIDAFTEKTIDDRRLAAIGDFLRLT